MKNSEKNIKAWAVVNLKGEFCWTSNHKYDEEWQRAYKKRYKQIPCEIRLLTKNKKSKQ